jgi:hypothetical protein
VAAKDTIVPKEQAAYLKSNEATEVDLTFSLMRPALPAFVARSLYVLWAVFRQLTKFLSDPAAKAMSDVLAEGCVMGLRARQAITARSDIFCGRIV